MRAVSRGGVWLTSTGMRSNFTLKETECKCGCGTNNVAQELVDVLQLIRVHVGVPVIINSCIRCPEHNAKIGGSKKSRHVEGIAADIAIKNPSNKFEFLESEKLFLVLTFLTIPCIIEYPGQRFVHVDVRHGHNRLRKEGGFYVPI